ncbi:hypothetical protein SAMN05216412_101238 [Nitrosospira multiformis]|uniref:Uncharacterized protein n=1 Tax=Nitrosospira multiformis TaxID=1231 RepID=A0A1H9YI13_9PROT|nr:hypothetical protein [Nitrosospira multiformis]SES68694.1 hypothetical protein SAMN05216412_101238 [Nitrosospira multiformis]
MMRPEKIWSSAIRSGLVSGTVASVVSTIALSILGKAELDKFAAPVNGPSQWIWGRHAPYQDHFSLRYTLIGYAIHHAASVFWAIWYEKLRQQLPPAESAASILAPAVATTAAAYVVDFHFTPKRLTPGFEHRLSQPSLLIVYGTFAFGLAVTVLLSRKPPRRRCTASRFASPINAAPGKSGVTAFRKH